MRPGRLPWIAARLVLCAFCWTTAAYALLTMSAFAYPAFIRPRVYPSIGAFSDWHAVGLWVWCGLLLVTVRSDATTRRTRASALGLIAAAVFAAAYSTWHPALPRLSGGGASLAVAVLALVPIVWLASIDFIRTRGFLAAQHLPITEAAQRIGEARLLAATTASALFVTALFSVRASVAMTGLYEPDLGGAAVARGVLASLVTHVGLASAAFLFVAILARVVRRTFYQQWVALSAALTVTLALGLDRLAAGAIGLSGTPEFVAVVSLAVSIAATWAAIRLSSWEAQGVRLSSPLDVYFGPPRDAASSLASIAALSLVAVFAWLVVAMTAHLDWDALLLDSGIVVTWLTAFGAIHRTVNPRAPLAGRVLATVCLAPLILQFALENGGMGVRHVLDRYAVYDASFRLADVVHRTEAAPSFDRFLVANTGFTSATPAPIDIDFVSPLGPPPHRPPNVFLFIVDSLRPDYLGAYNSGVHFTPALDRFAADSDVFTNVFTRYGGTGMSVPAIWAGSALLHKQYVQPFHTMNALEKLLDAAKYQLVITRDAVVQQLIRPPAEGAIELDRGRPTMDVRLCRSLEELATTLAGVDRSRPVFAYSQAADIHVTQISGPQTVASSDAGPFYRPVADAVRTMDACFGRFIDTLKERGEYDDSVIIVTADHGDMLGEDGRFGHGYFLFPPVVQIPLIVHLPAWLSDRPADHDALRLSTDITPTLYAAAGYRPVRATPLMGQSFIGENGEALAERRREQVVLAASYGAVYGVLGHNGRRLYIADAMNHTDYEYERDGGRPWRAEDVTADLREVNQFAIRQYADEIARMYHVATAP